MIWLLVDSSSVGGIERHIAILADALGREGYDVEVVLLKAHGDNPWLRQLCDAGVPFRILDGSIIDLFGTLQSERPALLHTHGYKANIFGRLVTRVLGIPVVSTFHAGERAPFPVNMYQIIDEITSALGSSLCVSEAIRNKLPYKSVLSENFIIAPSTTPTGSLPRRIGFVGRLSHEKGPDLFCEIARRHRNAGEWHVWGDGPMRRTLEREYGKDVHFHGLVTDLGPVWRSLGLLLMPSRAEGLPMAALEALSSGVPIVASKVGGMPRIVSEGLTGWLFEAEALDGASRGIAQWLALNPAAQEAMRQSCWRFVHDRFSHVRHLPTILRSYRDAGFTQSLRPLRVG